MCFINENLIVNSPLIVHRNLFHDSTTCLDVENLLVLNILLEIGRRFWNFGRNNSLKFLGRPLKTTKSIRRSTFKSEKIQKNINQKSKWKTPAIQLSLKSPKSYLFSRNLNANQFVLKAFPSTYNNYNCWNWYVVGKINLLLFPFGSDAGSHLFRESEILHFRLSTETLF